MKVGREGGKGERERRRVVKTEGKRKGGKEGRERRDVCLEELRGSCRCRKEK